VTTETGETYAEVAHEAIFRRWDKLREWIAAEREFLAWRSGLEAARRAWLATPDATKQDALVMGAALTQAQSWLAKKAEDLSGSERDFIALSIERERKAQARVRRIRALAYVLLIGVIVGLIGWIEQSYIKGQWTWYATDRPFLAANMWPYVLTPAAEQALKPDPNQSFRDCAPKQQDKDYCPDMVVIAAGSFMMGSPTTEQGHQKYEEPQHTVTIAKPFSVSKYGLTFDEWDTCVNYGDCPEGVSDSSFGRGQQPVINVTWDDAQHYVAWLSKMTGKTYRLLSEAEYEYATRAGTQTAYPWGNDIKLNGTAMANCNDCGSKWDNSQTAPVGSFAPNKFGLYDMVGNVLEWTEDCVHNNYEGAPADGSAWIEGGNCKRRIDRGGSWLKSPDALRSAVRSWNATDFRNYYLGVRVARTLLITP
jgi:formylglycine-generating enzyme required for sulfatase activity